MRSSPGLATSLGAAISMGFSEALSDTGELTGRGSPVTRGAITGGGTFIGGILHSLPFLIPHYGVALSFAVAVVGLELLTLAYLRYRFFADTFVRALGIVTFAGVVIAGRRRRARLAARNAGGLEAVPGTFGAWHQTLSREQRSDRSRRARGRPSRRNRRGGARA